MLNTGPRPWNLALFTKIRGLAFEKKKEKKKRNYNLIVFIKYENINKNYVIYSLHFKSYMLRTEITKEFSRNKSDKNIQE